MRVTSRLLAGALVSMSFVTFWLLPAATAHADDGAVLRSETVYRLDPDRPAVTVEATYTMTNVLKNKSLGGGRYEYYFFHGMVAPIDKSAAEITVEINGRDGQFELNEDNGVTYLDIDFGYQLRYDKSATIVVRWVLLGDAPRTDDSIIRVNPAYASFGAYALGDPGRSSVRIEVPTGWEHEYIGDDLLERTEDGVRIFEATEIDDPDLFSVWFTARRDDLLTSIDVEVGDASFEVRTWPGDSGWQDFAAEQITQGVPALEGLLGTDWPVSVTTEVIEASTPYLRGYAGVYYAYGDFIEIGEDLDRQTFLHELGHAWLNGEGFTDRWLIEGLAEDFSAQSMQELGDQRPDPATLAELRSDGWESTTFPLEQWDERPRGVDDDGSESYGYATSFRVIRALRDEIGDDRMTAVLSDVLSGHRAYPDEDEPVATFLRVDWRSFLDLAEQVGGSTEWQTELIDLVLTVAQIDELERRNDTVADYEDLVERGGSWMPPTAVRNELGGWRLEPADDRIEQANGALDARDDLAELLDPIGLEPVEEIEIQYQETVGTFDTLMTTFAEHTEAAGALVAARAELSEVLGGIGLDVPPLDQTGYEAAPTTVDDDTRRLVSLAHTLSDTQAELDGVTDELGVDVPRLAPNAFVTDAAEAQRLLNDRLAAARSVVALREQRAAATSITEKVGLVRSDIDERVDALDDRLENDEFEEIATDRTELIDDIDELDEAGVRRITIAGVAAATIALAVLSLLIIRRRRRARRVEHEPATAMSPVFAPPTGLSDCADDAADPAPDQTDAGEAGAGHSER